VVRRRDFLRRNSFVVYFTVKTIGLFRIFWQYNVSFLSCMEHQKCEMVIFIFKVVIFRSRWVLWRVSKTFWHGFCWRTVHIVKNFISDLKTFLIWKAKILWTSWFYLTQSVRMKNCITSFVLYITGKRENFFLVKSPSKILGTGDLSKFSKDFLPVNSFLKKKHW